MTKKILTVDDSRTMRDMLMLALSDAGYEVVQAEDGIDGLETLEREGADVVITDILMPADSIDLVVALRNEHPAVPFIVVSGLAARSVPTAGSGATPGCPANAEQAVQARGTPEGGGRGRSRAGGRCLARSPSPEKEEGPSTLDGPSP